MSFVFYDTETTGTNTQFDQILQFAAIKTDSDLNEIGRFEIRCRLQPHIVPSPDAMRITGITAEQLRNPALPSHYEMVRTINTNLLAWSPSIFCGYNSLDFDENLVRQALYQTLHRPYLTNTNGNARSDVLRMVQAAFLFAPNAVAAPMASDGMPVFKLDRLAPHNGFAHTHAHDAMGDVEATIFVCRLLAERAPDVWSAFMRFSQKAAVVDYIRSEAVFCLSDFYFGRPYSWLVTILGANPANGSEFYTYDLSVDPDGLSALTDQELAERLGLSPKPIRRLKANAAPIIMAAEDAPERCSAKRIDPEEINRRAEVLAEDEALRTRLLAAIESTRQEWERSSHVEQQLYDGFFSPGDQAIMDEFHTAPWEQRLSIVQRFSDSRLRTLGLRLIHHERPDLLHQTIRFEHDLNVARRIGADSSAVPWLTLSAALSQVETLLAGIEGQETAHLEGHRQFLSERLREAEALLQMHALLA